MPRCHLAYMSRNARCRTACRSRAGRWSPEVGEGVGWPVMTLLVQLAMSGEWGPTLVSPRGRNQAGTRPAAPWACRHCPSSWDARTHVRPKRSGIAVDAAHQRRYTAAVARPPDTPANVYQREDHVRRRYRVCWALRLRAPEGRRWPISACWRCCVVEDRSSCATPTGSVCAQQRRSRGSIAIDDGLLRAMQDDGLTNSARVPATDGAM